MTFHCLTTEIPLSDRDRLAMWRRRYYLEIGHTPNGDAARHVRFTRSRSEYIDWLRCRPGVAL